MEIVRRGYVPQDSIEFGAKAAEQLNAAAQELVFLMDRGYDTKSTSTFVGNHHLLSERQRMALARIVSTASAVQRRKRKELIQAPDYLVLDGFNTIITLEVALSGSLLLEGMDGTIRDLAGLRGSYRIVDKTIQAVQRGCTGCAGANRLPAQLDVKRYGVIVSCGGRRGLLLPDLEDVDTVEQQIDIARQKGGISAREHYTLERFEVVRHT